MRKVNRLIFLFLLQFCRISSSAQNVDSILANARGSFSFEKLYLQYDKQHYAPGETIWCQAYIQKGSLESSSVKIQLLDTKGTVVTENVFPVISSVATGNVTIPADVLTGRYFIKAFTDRAVKEQDNGQAFIQPFLVIKTSGQEPLPYQRKIGVVWSFDKQPVITGVQNEISFYLTDQYHVPIQAAVALIAGEKDTVCTAYSSESGTGKLLFTADKSQFYGAVAFTDTDTITSSLPKATEGINFIATALEGIYHIQIGQSTLDNRRAKFLLGEMDMTATFLHALKADRKKEVLTISTDSIPSGIIRLTLLDDRYEPLAEKFVFVYHPEEIIDLKQGKTTLLPRNDSLQIENTMAAPGEMAVSASVSVSNEEHAAIYPKQNIVSRLLFTSFFSQPLPQVPALFEHMDHASLSVLNSLLGVIRINRPSWTAIKNSKPAPEKMLSREYISFSGKITGKNDKRVKMKDSNLTFILQTADSARKYFTVPVSGDGLFEQHGLVFTDSAKVYYQTDAHDNDAETRAVITSQSLGKELSLNSGNVDISMEFPPFLIDTVSTTMATATPLLPVNSSKTTLKNVTVTGMVTSRQKTNELEKRYTRGLFTKDAGKRIDFVNDPPLNQGMTVLDYVDMRYPGIMAHGNGWAYYLNEAPVNLNEMAYIKIHDVALVKIYQRGGFMMAGGKDAMAVYLKKSDDISGYESIGLKDHFFMLKGYDVAKDFTPATIAGNPLSYTFYWNPFLHVAAGKGLDFTIPQTKMEGQKTLLMEGFTSNGDIFFHRERIR